MLTFSNWTTTKSKCLAYLRQGGYVLDLVCVCEPDMIWYNDTVCASSLNCFKHRLEKDESFRRLLQSVWLRRLSQSPPGEASSGKLSGKLSQKSCRQILKKFFVGERVRWVTIGKSCFTCNNSQKCCEAEDYFNKSKNAMCVFIIKFLKCRMWCRLHRPKG